MKKVFVLPVIIACLVSIQVDPASAQQVVPKKASIQLKNGQVVTDRVILSKLDLPKPNPNATLMSVWYVETPFTTKTVQSTPLVQTEGFGSYYVTKSSGYSSWGPLITSARATGPFKLTISTQHTTAATISYSFGASGGAFTQTLGYTYNETKMFQVAGEFNVPANESWTLAAYESVYITPYSVYYSPWFGADEWQGDGYAYRPVGVIYSQWKN